MKKNHLNTSKLFIVRLIMPFIPETRGFGFKRTLYKWAGVTIGKDVRICSSTRIIGSGQLAIGDHTWIGPDCLLSVSSSVEIGSYCNLAPRVLLVTGTHEIDVAGLSIAGKGYNEDIEIGDGVWLCARTTVLGGTVIGNKSILAAGAVAKGSYGGLELLAGTLAHTVKKLDEA